MAPMQGFTYDCKLLNPNKKDISAIERLLSANKDNGLIVNFRQGDAPGEFFVRSYLWPEEMQVLMDSSGRMIETVAYGVLDEGDTPSAVLKYKDSADEGEEDEGEEEEREGSSRSSTFNDGLI